MSKVEGLDFTEEQMKNASAEIVNGWRDYVSVVEDLFKQGKYFKNAKQAVIAILINNAFIEESEYKANFIATVLAAFDLKFKL